MRVDRCRLPSDAGGLRTASVRTRKLQHESTVWARTHCGRSRCVATPIAGTGVGSAPQAVQDLQVVDCLLPGQVRQRSAAARIRRRGARLARRPTTAARAAASTSRTTAQTIGRPSTFGCPRREQGDAEAQTIVGEIYERGLGARAELRSGGGLVSPSCRARRAARAVQSRHAVRARARRAGQQAGGVELVPTGFGPGGRQSDLPIGCRRRAGGATGRSWSRKIAAA